MELDDELLEYFPAPFDDMAWQETYPIWAGWDGYVRGIRTKQGAVGEGRGPTAADWADFLDRHRIERSVLYPTQGLTLGVYQDPEWAVALARAYNDWIYDRFMKVDKRLMAVALLPI